MLIFAISLGFALSIWETAAVEEGFKKGRLLTFYPKSKKVVHKPRSGPSAGSLPKSEEKGYNAIGTQQPEDISRL